VRLKVHRSAHLWSAGFFAFASAMVFPDRNDGHGLPWHRYTWLLLLLAAASALFRALQPAKIQPKSEAE